MPIEVFDNVSGRLDSRYLTVDSQGRIYLTTGTQELLGIIGQSSVRLYVGYDPVNKRIGLGKPEVMRLVNVGTYLFSGKEKRMYASCREFCKKYGIYPKGKKSERYLYHGKEGDWFTFQLEGYQAPDDRYLKPHDEK